MGKSIREIFQEWWESEIYKTEVSIFTAFEKGWWGGFKKSEYDYHMRKRLILNAIRPLVPNLDEIIVKALTSLTTKD